MYQSALKLTMTGYMPIALQLYTQKTVEQDRFFFFLSKLFGLLIYEEHEGFDREI